MYMISNGRIHYDEKNNGKKGIRSASNRTLLPNLVYLYTPSRHSKNPIFNAIQYPLMLTTCDLEILNFGKEHLVGVLAGTKDTRSTSTRAHLLHLGGHLIGGCVTSSQHTYQSQEYFLGGGIQLSLPSM